MPQQAKQIIDQQLEQANLLIIHKQMPTALACISLAACGVFWDLCYIINNTTLYIWLGLILCVNSLRYLIDQYKFSILNPTQLKQLYFFGSLASGLLWGGILLIASSHTEIGAIVILTATAACSSALALISHASYPASYYAYAIPALAGMSISYTSYEASHDIVAFTLTLLFFLILIFYCRSLKTNFTSATLLKIKNEDLMVEIEKQAFISRKANLDKSRFLTAVSHDLRQPFHALSLFVDAIDETSLNEETRKILVNIKHSITAQERLFTEFLDISKLDAGVITPHITCFSTHTLLHKLRLEYQNITKNNELAFHYSNLDCFIKSDQLLCERIIRNMLSNAVSFTSTGSISIEVTATTKTITIAIIDTGIGIQEDKLDTIFSEFVQLDNPERDRNNGLGLGLATAKQHCSLLEIDLDVTSCYGKGSTFSITLDRHWPDLQQLQDYDEFSCAQQIQTIEGAKVLIIDNDRLVLKATRTQLIALGCKVSCASNLEEALYILDGDSEKPDILLCDLRLNGKYNGIAVIQKINHFLKQQIPSIIITAETSQESTTNVLKTASLLLHKPIKKAKFVMALHTLLNKNNTIQRD